MDEKIRPVASVPQQLSSEIVLGNEREDGIDAFTEWRLRRLKALEAETTPVLSEAGNHRPQAMQYSIGRGSLEMTRAMLVPDARAARDWTTQSAHFRWVGRDV